MYDAVIIGMGPAGLSAALYLCRADLQTAVIGKDGGALEKAGKIENYFGLSEPLSGAALLEAGRAQASTLGAVLLDDEVLDLSWDNGFSIRLKDAGELRSRAVILATGVARKTAPIPGLSDLEGRGVSYCAVCDAFFFRGRDVAVLGAGDYALHEAEVLLPAARSVTVLTDGAEPSANFPDSIEIERRKLSGLIGGGVLSGVRFADGGERTLDGLFVALGSAAAGDLARKLGAEVEQNRIVVDREMATALPGLFAAGDCTGGLLQVATAVSDGAIAAMSAIRFLRQK